MRAVDILAEMKRIVIIPSFAIIILQVGYVPHAHFHHHAMRMHQ